MTKDWAEQKSYESRLFSGWQLALAAVWLGLSYFIDQYKWISHLKSPSMSLLWATGCNDRYAITICIATICGEETVICSLVNAHNTTSVCVLHQHNITCNCVIRSCPRVHLSQHVSMSWTQIFDLVITNATLITLLHFVTLGHFEHSVVLLTNEIQGTSGSHLINRFSQIKDCLNEFITTTICINYM